MTRTGRVAALLCSAWAFAAQAQTPLFEEVRTVSSVATPVESSEFTVAAAGQHEITLTDLGALLTPAAPATTLQLAVMRGSTVAATLTAAGTTQVNLPAGNYVIRVAGQPGPAAGSGLFSAAVRAAGAAQPVFSFNNALSAIPPLVPGNVRLFQGNLTLPAGNYELQLVDLAFPQALTFGSVIVTSGASVAAQVNLPSTTAALTSGVSATYSIYALGDSPQATNAGLFMIRVRDVTNNTVMFAQLLPVGRVTSLGTSPALAVGSYSLVAADLAFPAALTQSGAVIANKSVLGQPVETARLAAAGTLPFSIAAPGIYEVFGLAVPATPPGGGALAVEIRQAATKLFTAVRAVGGDAASGTPVLAFPVEIGSPDSYAATVTDMQFPSALASVNAAISQGAAVVARRDTAGAVSGNLIAGRAFVLVAARPATATGTLQQGGGLLGVTLAPTGLGGPLLQTTQGVGGVFSSRTFAIAATGDYRFTVDDVGFPAVFSELGAAVTRGTERLGLIYGKGSFDVLQATPGNYVITFISRPDATIKSGTYSLSAAIKPLTPTLTLSANPVSPAVGGTTDITWSAQNASACVASGSWSGSRAVSGTERSAAINTASTYTLNCTGAGGSVNASLTVTPAAQQPNNSGGGGSLNLAALLSLAAMLLAGILRRGLIRAGTAAR